MNFHVRKYWVDTMIYLDSSSRNSFSDRFGFMPPLGSKVWNVW
jgi:hypothetical protein